MAQERFGILLRYSDSQFGVEKDTVVEHNRIVKKHGRAAVGKVGRRVAEAHLTECSNKKRKPVLFLVTRIKNKGYLIHAAPLDCAQTKRPRRELVPAYYRNSEHVSCWFTISAPLMPVTKNEKAKWRVRNSQFPLRESLQRSMAGFFVVTRDAASRPEALSRQSGKFVSEWEPDAERTDDDVDDLLRKLKL